MSSLLLPRIAVALVWLYQGLWCKLLGRAPHHLKIIGTTPFMNASCAQGALLALGSLECVLAAWVLSGSYPYQAALAQTLLLASMNFAGLRWGRALIADPIGMLLQNFVFLLLAWVAAGHLTFHATAA